MHLRSVELINWRSYRHARFNFPTPYRERNVILIKAPNEYGKTSFFEAIALGIFGREGLVLVPRAKASSHGNADEVINTSYSQFLTNTLHYRAIDTGPAKCSVTIEVEDDNGYPIELSRIWHFRKNGQHKPSDDNLTIFQGIEREPVSPPLGITNRDQWYSDWIAQNFLHPSLAEFFLFDGEQVQRYANREMSEQVQKGIEGLLGFPILKNLKDSLASYAQNQRSSAAAPSDKVVEQVEKDISRILEEKRKKEKIYDEASMAIPKLEEEIDELTKIIGGRGEGTQALLERLIQNENRYREEARRSFESLMALIQKDIALALAGHELREQTINRLEQEKILEKWEAGKSEGASNFNRFSKEFMRRISTLEPPLDKFQLQKINEAGEEAWEALWYPAPNGCAENFRHPYLQGTSRQRTIDFLQSIANHSEGEVKEKVECFHLAIENAENSKRKWQELQTSIPEIEKFTQKLKERSEQLGKLTSERNGANNSLEGLNSDLGKKRAEFGRYMERKGTSLPALRRANFADKYSALIQELLQVALPREVGGVAQEMTRVWKAMAHHSDRVDKIEITPECKVKMLTVNGEDLHVIDKSAGASQVFTQALITAITKVSGRAFPFVVDTPLARLSREQRIGVLKTFTDRTGQVILLSTDEEVIGDKVDAIRDRLLVGFELKITTDNGITVTHVQNLDLKDI